MIQSLINPHRFPTVEIREDVGCKWLVKVVVVVVVVVVLLLLLFEVVLLFFFFFFLFLFVLFLLMPKSLWGGLATC